jgi:hypothetical protein
MFSECVASTGLIVKINPVKIPLVRLNFSYSVKTCASVKLGREQKIKAVKLP